MSYSAKQDYQSKKSAETYESRPMYRGLLGYLRKRIENRVIDQFIAALPQSVSVLDCPCGNGRWFSTLAKRASRIQGVDVSVGMTEYAKAREVNSELSVSLGDAEALQFDNDAHDYVFSYALMKHIPVETQGEVLKEFARVSRQGIICSFALFNTLSYRYWLWSKPAESYPLFQQQLDSMAAAAGLKIVKQKKISQPIIGLEYLVQFELINFHGAGE